MPYSDGENKDVIKSWVKDLEIDSVLDIGAGAGVYRDLLADLNIRKWTAIEVWSPYVTQFKLRERYDEVIMADITYIDNTYLWSDLTIMGDIVEHFPKDEAVKLIERVLKHCSYLVISLPTIHFEQGEWEGNWFETHHHHWTHDEVLEVLGDRVIKDIRGDILGCFLVKGDIGHSNK